MDCWDTFALEAQLSSAIEFERDEVVVEAVAFVVGVVVAVVATAAGAIAVETAVAVVVVADFVSKYRRSGFAAVAVYAFDEAVEVQYSNGQVVELLLTEYLIVTRSCSSD